MTASLSMRNSPSISEKTRERVKDAADKLGYRPDPEIARLMGRLRSSRVEPRSVVIALLDIQGKRKDHPYNKRLREGIERQLDLLGYGYSYFRLRDYKGDISKILRVVHERGIVGSILLPSDQPVSFPETVKWDGLSIVAATTSVQFPRFHRVGPNQVFNAMSVVEEMQRRGYKKIGAILSESLEQRQKHRYSLALTWYGYRDQILILPDDVSAEDEISIIKKWIRDHPVDVLFVQDVDKVMRALKAGKFGIGAEQVGLVSLGAVEEAKVACLDELPEFIGESAVNLLAGMMYNNESGVPQIPHTTVVDGVFRESETIRPQTNVEISKR